MSWKRGLKSGCLEGRQLVFGEKLAVVYGCGLLGTLGSHPTWNKFGEVSSV